VSTTWALRLFLYYGGAYHQVTTDHIAAAGVAYDRGVTTELDLMKGSTTLRLIDDQDQYRPSNPAGPLYDIIGPYLPYAYDVAGSPRSAGSIDILTPDRTKGHAATAGVTTRGVRWVDVKLTDPIGELGRWREVVTSPMRGFISALPTLRDYWPGEDGANAAVMSAAVGTPAPAQGVTFEGSDGPSGSNKLLTLGSSGRIRGKFSKGISTTSWQICFATDMAGADGTERTVFQWTTSNGWTWSWKASTTTYRLDVVDADGSSLLSWGLTNGDVDPGENVLFVLKAHRSGSTWTAEAWWWEEGETVLWGGTNTFSGAAGRPTSWTVFTNTIMNGAYFGHLFAVTTQTDNLLSYNALHAAGGYPRETTADRFERACDQRNIPNQVLGSGAAASPMGPQRPGTTKQQLQEIQRTEQGLIFPSRDGRGLVLALRDYLYQQSFTPALELTAPVDTDPKEVASAAELYNVVIASNRSGDSVTAVETAGRYGTADPPDGIGVVDKEVKVNHYTIGELANAANSWMRYFQQVLAFGEITVDLDDDDIDQAVRDAAEAADVGMFIRLTGATPDPVLLLIIGVSGRDQRTRSTITFTVVPGDVWDIGTWDGPSVWQLATCTVKTAASNSATTLVLKLTDDEAWSTTAEPYDLMVAGERVTVTTMGARTGTPGDWEQQATVTRSVNGVVKAQVVGASVKAAGAKRWGW
jgi:hypothetical protein